MWHGIDIDGIWRVFLGFVFIWLTFNALLAYRVWSNYKHSLKKRGGLNDRADSNT